MTLIEQIKILVHKEIILEWRSKFALNGILLYVVSTVFVCYQAFHTVDTFVWNALFWIIMLFASINAINKSFIQESPNRQLYYYTLTDPRAVIFSKIIYNMLLMIFLSVVAYFFYSTIFKNPIGNPLLYFFTIVVGSISFASVFTMVSGISAKAGNNSTLMAILSFPVIIPLLIILIKLSLSAIEGAAWGACLKEISALIAINVITIIISLLLFPYLWRD